MVEPVIVEPQLLRPATQGAGNALAEVLRRIADADHAIAQHPADGFGDEPDRVREVDEERLGRAPLDNLCDLRDNGHGAQGKADSPGARRFLPDRPGLDRHGLVDQPAFEAADADGAVDDVGAVDRILEAGRRPVADGGAFGLVDAPQDGLDPLQPGCVDVVQDDLVVGRPRPAARDRPVDDGRPKPTPTQDRELHAAQYAEAIVLGPEGLRRVPQYDALRCPGSPSSHRS